MARIRKNFPKIEEVFWKPKNFFRKSLSKGHLFSKVWHAHTQHPPSLVPPGLWYKDISTKYRDLGRRKITSIITSISTRIHNNQFFNVFCFFSTWFKVFSISRDRASLSWWNLGYQCFNIIYKIHPKTIKRKTDQRDQLKAYSLETKLFGHYWSKLLSTPLPEKVG